MKKRIISIVALVLCAAVALCGCGAKTVETKNDKELDSAVVAKIGKQKITQADYNFLYSLVYANMSQYAMYYGEDWENMELEEGKTIAEFMEENALDQVKQMAAAVELAKEYKITAGDVADTVAKQKKEIVDSYGSEDAYKKFLEDSRTTDKAVDRYLEICEIYAELFKKLTSKDGALGVSDKDLEKEFLEEYKDKWRVQHVLVSTQEQTDETGNVTAPAKSEAEAKKIADEVIAKLDEGSDFDSLIEKYDEDPGMEKGKFYVFGTGEMVPEFEEASKNLKIGEYTKEPVKTDYGYHIIKRYEINAEIDEFDQYKEAKLQEKAIEKVDKKVKDLKVTVDEKAIEKYMKAWAEDRAKEAEKAQSEAAPQENTNDTNAAESEEKAE